MDNPQGNARRRQLYHDTLIRWCNGKLERNTVSGPLDLVAQDCSALSEILVKLTNGRYNRYKQANKHRLVNAKEKSFCWRFLQDELPHISHRDTIKQDLREGNDNVLDLLAELVLQYCVVGVLRPGAKSQEEDGKVLFLGWINGILPSSRPNVRNFTTSWRDGTALGALLNGIHPSLCTDWAAWDPENWVGNITQAMDQATKHLSGIDKLVSATDLCHEDISDNVVITYLSQILTARLGKRYGYKTVIQYVEMRSDCETYSDTASGDINVHGVSVQEQQAVENSYQTEDYNSSLSSHNNLDESRTPDRPERRPHSSQRQIIQNKNRQLPPLPSVARSEGVQVTLTSRAIAQEANLFQIQYKNETTESGQDENESIDGYQNGLLCAINPLHESIYSPTPRNSVSSLFQHYKNDTSDWMLRRSQLDAETFPKASYSQRSISDISEQAQSDLYLQGPKSNAIGTTQTHDYRRLLSTATQTDIKVTSSVMVQVEEQEWDPPYDDIYILDDSIPPDVATVATSAENEHSLETLTQENDHLLIDEATVQLGTPHQISDTPQISESGQIGEILKEAVHSLPQDVKKMTEKFMASDLSVQIGRTLLEGTMGTYHRSRCTIDDEYKIVLTKSVPDAGIAGVRSLLMESQIRTKWKHLNIVELLNLTVLDDRLICVMPRMDHGTLHEYVTEHHQILDIGDRLAMTMDIASALRYITASDHVLMNISTHTCMVTEDRIVKVVDLSMASDIIDKGYTRYTGQKDNTYARLPLEILLDQPYTVASDIWMFAAECIWKIFNPNVEPFTDKNVFAVVASLSKGERLPQLETIPDSIYRLLLTCWLENPKDRPNFTSICNKLHAIQLGGSDLYPDIYSRYTMGIPLSGDSYCVLPDDQVQYHDTVAPERPPKRHLWMRTSDTPGSTKKSPLPQPRSVSVPELIENKAVQRVNYQNFNLANAPQPCQHDTSWTTTTG